MEKGAVDKTAPFDSSCHGLKRKSWYTKGKYMAEKKKNIAALVTDLVKEAVEECGCTLWDVEFVKEGPDHNLIIYIDRPEGVSLTDCEMVNDAVEPLLDEADPIDGSYYLEISSPGLERELKTPAHLAAFENTEVTVKLYKALDGTKTLHGVLGAYDEENDSFVLACGETDLTLARKDVAGIRTVCDL